MRKIKITKPKLKGYFLSENEDETWYRGGVWAIRKDCAVLGKSVEPPKYHLTFNVDFTQTRHDAKVVRDFEHRDGSKKKTILILENEIGIVTLVDKTYYDWLRRPGSTIGFFGSWEPVVFFLKGQPYALVMPMNWTCFHGTNGLINLSTAEVMRLRALYQPDCRLRRTAEIEID